MRECLWVYVLCACRLQDQLLSGDGDDKVLSPTSSAIKVLSSAKKKNKRKQVCCKSTDISSSWNPELAASSFCRAQALTRWSNTADRQGLPLCEWHRQTQSYIVLSKHFNDWPHSLTTIQKLCIWRKCTQSEGDKTKSTFVWKSTTYAYTLTDDWRYFHPTSLWSFPWQFLPRCAVMTLACGYCGNTVRSE